MIVRVMIELPDGIYKRAMALAEEHGISVDELITIVLAKYTDSPDTINYIENWAKFQAALAQVPDVEPEANNLL